MEKYQNNSSIGWEPRGRGFTLIELVVTLAVLAIVLAIAIPSFQDFLRRNRVAAETNNLTSALALARSEAVKLAQRVTVCGVADPSAETPACADDSWSSGWIVFVDTGDVGDATGDTILRVQQPNAADAPDITPDDNFSTYISYLPSGVSLGDGGAASGTFGLCIDSESREVDVGPTGRISISNGACP
jgi:type IV fimbrial biogenesis protein FimT